MAVTKGVVTATVLNVRADPSTARPPTGLLSRGVTLRLLSKQDSWYHIETATLVGYVHGDYLAVIKPQSESGQGTVTATRLNVRPQASTAKAPIGALERGTNVEVLAREGGWYRIKRGDLSGYVYGDFIALVPVPVTRFLYEEQALQVVALPAAPGERIKATPGSSARQKNIAQVWNRYGGLLGLVSELIAVDVAGSVAVLSVESGGRGFARDARMIIRFENHIFWRQWGRSNEATFNAHFRYNLNKRWSGHHFREKKTGRWIRFHGDQALEWRALEFARRLNEPAALQSIS
ncbi:MAG: SH3 domain-containing protein, partial [Acidiferrobacterales bacterium]